MSIVLSLRNPIWEQYTTKDQKVASLSIPTEFPLIVICFDILALHLSNHIEEVGLFLFLILIPTPSPSITSCPRSVSQKL